MTFRPSSSGSFSGPSPVATRLRAALLAPVATMLVFVATSTTAGAQVVEPPKTDRSFEVQLWQTAIGGRGYFTVPSADVLGHTRFSLSLASSYQRNPFTLETIQGLGRVNQEVEVVRDQITTELTGAIGLVGRLQVGFALPFVAYQNGDDFTPMGTPTGTALDGASLGDLRVEAKIQAVSYGADDAFTLAVIPGLTLPTGDANKFTGDKNVTGRLQLVNEMRLENVRAAAMLGALFRQSSEIFAAKVGQQLLYGLAVDYRVTKGVSLLGELFGRSGLDDFGKGYKDANPLELDAGMRVGLPKMFTVTVGGGLGLIRGIGSPGFRGFLAIGWSPDFDDRDDDGVVDLEDRCPDDPEDRDGFRDDDGCPDLDNDGDGLLDEQDKCPLVAEDADQFQDEDGCPEADNDGDGIDDINDPCPNAAEDGGGKRPTDGCPSSAEDGDGDGVGDAVDRCPDEPEDRDGFEDEDGCPDLDNDNDGIPDNFDECPSEAEDPDGIDDADGCPDLDNDRDGIPDVSDRCPTEAETLNGNRDDDGCPDPGAALVTLAESTINLRERIAFSGPATSPGLTPGAQTLLNLVAMVLKGNPDLTAVRVEVQAEGTAAEVSQARADAVVAYLVGKGVEPGRLKAVGVGAGAAKVDFIIEERAVKSGTVPTAP